jgi:hypothetical protein
MSFNMLRKNSNVLHPLMAGNGVNANAKNVVCHLKIFISTM